VKLAVIGTGYVGLVVGACLAETGNDVECADVDAAKIARLRQNQLPIYEPGLEPLVVRNQASGRLAFTTDVGAAVESADIVLIAVGTPPDEDGSADLQHVLEVARTIGRHMNRPKIVATKSTVPVGTAARVRREISRFTNTSFHVASNPEFLKEGAAVEDFMKPDRIVVGVDSEEAARALEELYAPFVRTGNPLLVMDIPSAELTKYAANAMLATRISFMNQVAGLCEVVGADVTLVRKGLASDSRIGPAFLFPGPGYGGSCFPKDIKALVRTGEAHGTPLDLLQAVDRANERQKQRLYEKLARHFPAGLQGVGIAVWGLAFKAGTDDVRESPALVLVEQLLGAGARVRVHDPAALEPARRRFGVRVSYAAHAYDALEGTAALVIATEWLEYRNPDFDRIKRLLARPLIVDGRNLYDPERLARLGFCYESIGRPAAVGWAAAPSGPRVASDRAAATDGASRAAVPSDGTTSAPVRQPAALP
jgi:UDPglucose 6-dehydrogenase